MLTLRPATAFVLLGITIGLHAGCGSSSASEFPNGGEGDGGASETPPDLSLSSGDGSVPTSDAGKPNGPACATAEAQATRLPVYLDIVLDGSRSMDGHGPRGDTNYVNCDNRHTEGRSSTCFLANGRETDPLAPTRTTAVCHSDAAASSTCSQFVGLTGKKWIAVRGALLAYFADAKTRADKRLGIGLRLFPNEAAKPPTEWEIKPAFVDAAQEGLLRGAIAPPVFPIWSGTPTRTNVDGQAALMKTFVPTAPLESGGKSVLVVITDGIPTGTGNSKAETEAAVLALQQGTPSIPTFVVGVGDPSEDEGQIFDEKFLSRLAVAGGTGPVGCNPAWDGQTPNGTTPCHFQVTPGAKSAATIQAEMSAAIESISDQVQSCELALQQNAPIDPAKVNVVFVAGDGKETQIPADGANGWSYDNPSAPTKVTLSGSACADLKADPKAKVTIVIGCPTGTEVR